MIKRRGRRIPVRRSAPRRAPVPQGSNGRRYTVKELQELSAVFKHDPANLAMTGAQLHGPLQSGAGYGPLAFPGVRQTIYSALQRPLSLTQLFVNGGVINSSVDTDPIIAIHTGNTRADDLGQENAENYCGNPPQPGLAKFCKQHYPFGSWFFKTPLNVIPMTGQRVNYSDAPKDILNGNPNDNPFIPDDMWMFVGDDSMNLLRYHLWLVGVELETGLEQVFARGLAGALTIIGWMSEFNGLDQLIKTGHTDFETGVACPAADSWVGDFGGTNIDNADTQGRYLWQRLSSGMVGLQDRARRSGMTDVQYVIVGDPNLFWPLTYRIACSQAAMVCQTPWSGRGALTTQDATALRQLQLDMWNGKFLIINGQTIPFIESDGIPRENVGEDLFETTLYIVPISWRGSPLLTAEYFPFDNEYLTDYINYLGNDIRIINNGMYAVGHRHNGFCKELLFATRMRMILDVPWLAGRIDNIQFRIEEPDSVRDILPGMSFYADGGGTYWGGSGIWVSEAEENGEQV